MEAIIAILAPVFINWVSGCLERNATPADLKAKAEENFDAASGQYSEDFLKRCDRRARPRLRGAGHAHDHASVRAATVAMLEQARTGDHQTLASACADAHGEDDDE